MGDDVGRKSRRVPLAGHHFTRLTRVALPTIFPQQHHEQPLKMSSAQPLSTLNGSTPVQKPHEELQYLDLVREILDNGEHRPDR